MVMKLTIATALTGISVATWASTPTLKYTTAKPVIVKKAKPVVRKKPVTKKTADQIYISTGIGYYNGITYRIAAGYLFALNNWLAVGPELGYIAYPKNDTGKTRDYDAGVKAKVNFTSHFYMLAKAAGAYVQQTNHNTSKQSGFAPTAAAGLGYQFNQHISLDVTYQRLFPVGKIKMNQAALLTLNYTY